MLPANAKINGGISRQTFYDAEKTIMPEVVPDTNLTTQKYWEKNLFYGLGKYRPIFMLSNKELYNLKQEKRPSVVSRFSVPAIYNVSFKGGTVKRIALSTPLASTAATNQLPKQVQKIEQKTEQKSDLQSIYLYETAKNPEVEAEQKIDTAILLKETKLDSNYLLAIDLLNDVTNKEPYNAYAYYVKGELCSARHDTESAMINYIEALRLNPYSKQSYLGIAKILEPTNKTLAQKYYDKAK